MEKKIKLKKLVLANWRGQSREANFGETTRVNGKNETGKSTLMKAFFFCLSGLTEPYLPKNSNLYNKKEKIDENTPWASVEATLEIEGYEYVLGRKAKPKYTRARGSSTFVKASADEYQYSIDGIEVGSTAFDAWIEANICPVAMLPYLLSGDFFSYLIGENKNKSRAILTELVGEINESDFKGDYSAIKDLLGRYTASEIVEMSKKKKKPLEERQNIIPLEIDRKEERLAELKAMDFATYEKAIEDTKQRIDAIDGLLLGNADAVKPILDHNRKIENKVANKRLSIVNGRLDYKEEQKARTSKIKAEIAEIRRFNEGIEKENAKIKREFDEMDENAIAWNKKLSVLEEKRMELLKRRDEVKARVYTEEKCAYCGQELPYEMLEKAREKFNETKAKDLELIVKEGKAVAEEIAKAKERVEELGAMVEKGYTLLEKKSTTELEDALARVEASFVPFEDTDEFKRINAEIDALISEMKEIPSNDNEALTSEKKGLIEELSELSKKLGLKDEIGKTEKEIEELRGELRSVANGVAELEGQMYAAQSWLQERNEIVSFRINDKLEHSRIAMFSTQKNGEVVPDCLLLNKDGVDYSVTNGADRGAINTDLQKLFMRHYGVALPIFIEEAAIYDDEHLPSDSDYQMVYLFASNSHYLVIE